MELGCLFGLYLNYTKNAPLLWLLDILCRIQNCFLRVLVLLISWRHMIADRVLLEVMWFLLLGNHMPSFKVSFIQTQLNIDTYRCYIYICICISKTLHIHNNQVKIRNSLIEVWFLHSCTESRLTFDMSNSIWLILDLLFSTLKICRMES